jgi:pyruvate/2-oxoacid:ferredoxin oxidoreductase beta subunit
VFAYRQYGSIIKGNPTMFYQIRVSDRRIYSHGRWKNFDMLIALNDSVNRPPIWCPCCGDYGILNALRMALAELAVPNEEVVVSGVALNCRTS